jgi:probable blue pigment (indigoidine) exporter
MGQNNSYNIKLIAAGIIVAAYPLLKQSYATQGGILILFIGMLSYSAGAVYTYLSLTAGKHYWRFFLLPFLFVFYTVDKNIYDIKYFGGMLWLTIPVFIGAVQLWLYLLRDNPVRASFWLFLCPVFGFIIAAFTLQEPISFYTFTGVEQVIAGLYIIQQKNNYTFSELVFYKGKLLQIQ